MNFGERMVGYKVPFSREKIEEIIERWPTPAHVYDEKRIRETARALNRAFSWVDEKVEDDKLEGFKNHFAVKACPNPYILNLLKKEGFGTDCSSLPELIMSERAGIFGEEVMFTSNNTPIEEFQYARELGAIINLDDITHIDYLEKSLKDWGGLPGLICFRYNPGSSREESGLDINFVGEAKDQKYGLRKDQILEAYKIMRDKGVKRFGLHAMVVSNMLDVNYLIGTAEMLFDLVGEIAEKTGTKMEFVNLGGGVGIPYKLNEEPVDLEEFGQGVKRAYEEKIERKGLGPIRVIMECGRLITGPHGYLVARVRHVTEKHKNFVGLDACMANLMRPALYGAYHHITVLGKENLARDHVYDVTGSLCENNDKFAIDLNLPKMEPGDIVVIHNAGAHGYAMGFQYNGKLRSAELLVEESGAVKEIRRAETVADYFNTLDFSELRKSLVNNNNNNNNNKKIYGPAGI